MIEMLEQSENQQAASDSDKAIARPTGVDPDWDVKIQRAREAHEAGRRLREDQPATLTSLIDL